MYLQIAAKKYLHKSVYMCKLWNKYTCFLRLDYSYLFDKNNLYVRMLVNTILRYVVVV